MANKKPGRSTNKIKGPPEEHHVLDDTNPVLKKLSSTVARLCGIETALCYPLRLGG